MRVWRGSHSSGFRQNRTLSFARDALEATPNQIAEDPRLLEKNVLTLRRELLATAIPYFEKLSSQKSDDANLTAERGATYGRLANLRLELGELDAAQADFQNMTRVFEELMQVFPDNPLFLDPACFLLLRVWSDVCENRRCSVG